ncbi:MAG: prephenate dehydratase [Solirubrobacteraceae bacterium]
MSQPASALPRAAYLGPEGTFSEEALLGSVLVSAVQPVALETIRDAVIAVQEGAVEWALVPIENSIEGSVTVTLDTLAAQAGDVEIVGEWVLPVRHYLIAREPIEYARIATVVSHPHVPGQCRGFLQERLVHARIAAASSTAEAVRLVAEHDSGGGEAGEGEQWAAIGTRLAAELNGCVVIAEGIQDREDNETRFVWLARKDTPAGPPPFRSPAGPGRKTSLVFWGAGAGQAGWLVLCLDEFARRQINLTKIESRPMRERLGQYMFFVDLDGSLSEQRVGEALTGLRALCENVRVLGSYPTA